MPAKYHIHAHAAPPRVRLEGKLGIVDWQEDCSSCKNCVKKGCVYGLYRDEADTLHEELGYLDYIYQCKGCLTCIQNCTKNILTRVVNPEFERLGDDYVTPDIIVSTWSMAETGAVPVSGCGYGGPFSGRGFDSIWTDMSEIVRPTRDGIHGREYINTSVDIGRKTDRLYFQDMKLVNDTPPIITSPLPLLFDDIPAKWRLHPVVNALVKAARELKLYAIVGDTQLDSLPDNNQETVVPLVEKQEIPGNKNFAQAPMIVVPDAKGVLDDIAAAKRENARRIVAVRMETNPGSVERVRALAKAGVEVVNIVFDSHGREFGAASPRHMRDVLREVHLALVKDRLRDEVTLISSGGIALPEHMAKAVICGADCVAVDLPLLVAMDCRLCGECGRGGVCPVNMAQIDEAYAVQRIINLMCSWHSQLLEMLGAMGIREARRLRGEKGRSMFFEDLERDAFGRLFGKRKTEFIA
jgi:ferredoxin